MGVDITSPSSAGGNGRWNTGMGCLWGRGAGGREIEHTGDRDSHFASGNMMPLNGAFFIIKFLHLL